MSSIRNITKLPLIEQAKRSAAFLAVDEHVKNNMVIGIGSGSTVVYVVDRIIEVSALCLHAWFWVRLSCLRVR